MKNPFELPTPEWFPADLGPMFAWVVRDQLRVVREADADQLRAILEWPGTGVTVRRAAQRRLRTLAR